MRVFYGEEIFETEEWDGADKLFLEMKGSPVSSTVPVTRHPGNVAKETVPDKPEKEMRIGIAYPAFYDSFKQYIPKLEVIKDEYDVANFDLIIFSGGQDINPELYGEENRSSWGCSDNRDKIESTIFKSALEYRKKVFGVCRGHQLINAILGGNLFQDLSEASKLGIKCIHPGNHTLQHQNGHSILNYIPEKVNSMHHQGINIVAPEMVILSTYKTIPEICASRNNDQILTVQFHPEFMENSTELFKWLTGKWLQTGLTKGKQLKYKNPMRIPITPEATERAVDVADSPRVTYQTTGGYSPTVTFDDYIHAHMHGNTIVSVNSTPERNPDNE